MPPDSDGAFGVLFVCTGNICRSPTAEALARREQPGDDIDDPLGQSSEAYATCAERLDSLVTPVIAALVKTMPVGTQGPTW